MSEARIMLVQIMMVSELSNLLGSPNRYLTISYAISNQNIITRATNRKSRDRNCSSMCCGVPGAAVRH